jgi:hypothetical protein
MNWRQKVALLAVLIEGLPEVARFAFFNRFRDDIGDFFEGLGEKPLKRWLKEKLPDAVALKRWAWAKVASLLPFPAIVQKGTEGADTFPVRLWSKVPLRVHWRCSLNGRKGLMRWEWETDEAGLEWLVKEVAKLPLRERHCLWALLDDALADYEDYLLATEPQLIARRDDAYRRMEAGEFVRLEALKDVGSSVGSGS